MTQKAAELDPLDRIIVRDEQRRLKPCNLRDFLELDLPERKRLLGEWLPSQGVCMVYATRGVGKTYFALNVAVAVASGGSFLGWQCEAATGVLYLDGEMPACVLQERLATIVAASEQEDYRALDILSPDLQGEAPMPDIASVDGQRRLEPLITEDIGLIIVDNISTLTSGNENEAEGWASMQGWALRQRAAGKSVLLIHHAGKGGAQRGTSKREDILDTVIALRHPADYEPREGARFEVHFEKARGVIGDAVQPIEARLEIEGGRQRWNTLTLEDAQTGQIAAMKGDGMSQKDIANELGVTQSTVSRRLKKARSMGKFNV